VSLVSLFGNNRYLTQTEGMDAFFNDTKADISISTVNLHVKVLHLDSLIAVNLDPAPFGILARFS